MDILRQHDKLAGFTFPYGDVLIYDLKKRRTTFYPGVPEYRRKNVSREIWATKKGKVYFSYHTPDFWLWELDVKSGVMQRTQQRNILSNGYLHGMVATRNGNTVYLLTNRGGNLYSFDVETERLKYLGSLLPPEEIAQGQSIQFVFGLILSQDEKKLYTLPCRFADGNVPTLYEYDIETGDKTQRARFPSLTGGTVTGTNAIDDRGRLYFGYHTYDEGESARLIPNIPRIAFGQLGLPLCTNKTRLGGIMQVVWELDNLEQLGDNKLDVSGRPAVIAGPYGPAIEFDGVRDALFIGANPLAGLEAFTIELDFRPDEGGLAEQRFLHLGGSQRRPRAFRDAADRDWALVSRHLYQFGRLGPGLIKQRPPPSRGGVVPFSTDLRRAR